jgi:hypothetical protein
MNNMTPLGHAGIAALAGIALTKVVPTTQANTVLLGTVLGGTLLDLDLLYRLYQKRSKVFDKTIGKHRFFPTHTPLFAFIISIIIFLFNFYLGLSFFIGAMIHLFIDTLFFPEGINFFYPLNKKMITFLTIKTHPFFAPKRISQVNGWWKNYLTSPLFWITEVIPTFIAFVVLLRYLK